MTVREEQQDIAWGKALELLQQFCNPLGILDLLAAGAAVPQWVRDEIAAWCRGERPPLPRRSAKDERLLAAKRAYGAAPRAPRTGRDAKIAQFARDHRVNERTLRSLVEGKDRPSLRLVTRENAWKRIYIDRPFAPVGTWSKQPKRPKR